MCKHCHGCFDPLTNSVIPGAHPHAGRHKTINCHWLNQHQHVGIVGGGAPVAGVHPCDFCRLHNPGVPHHRTHKCSDFRNPAGKAARGGGVFCTFCNTTSHDDTNCNNPNHPKNSANKPARAAPVAVLVARGGGGAATPAWGTIVGNQFWNGKGWRLIQSRVSKPGGTLVKYFRMDGVLREVQVSSSNV